MLNRMKLRLRAGREVLLLAYLPVYLALFAWVERAIPESACHITNCPLDAQIPLVRQFVWVYVSWYFLMGGMAVRLLRRDRRAFARYGWSIVAGFTLSILIFFIYPSAQKLRPAGVPGGDLSAGLLWLIYRLDTDTNVLPSMHVVGTLCACIAAFDARGAFSPRARAAVAAWGALIIASTLLIRQHSVLDVAAGAALTALIFPAIYILPRKAARKRGRAGTTPQLRESRPERGFDLP